MQRRTIYEMPRVFLFKILHAATETLTHALMAALKHCTQGSYVSVSVNKVINMMSEIGEV